MKSKKLFAILTLVAFMMTLVPMAAFAARGDGNRFSTTVAMNKTACDADGVESVEFTVYVYDSANAPVADEIVYIASNRGATDDINVTGYDGDKKGSTNLYYAETDSNGKVVFKVRSKVVGTPKIAVSLDSVSTATADNLYQYMVGSTVPTAESVKLIATKDVTFRGTNAGAIDIFEVKYKNRATDSKILTTYNQGTDMGGVANVYYSADANYRKANDLDYYEVKVKVTNGIGAPSADQTVDFSVNKANARLSATQATTDANGQAYINVYAKKGGVYTITAKTGNYSKDINLYFDAGDVVDIKMISSDNRKIAATTNPYWDFEVFDAMGNKIKPATGTNMAGVTVELVSKPDGVTVSDTNFTKQNDGNNDYLRVTGFTFNKEGDYKMRVSLGNGKFVETAFKIVKQGILTKMTVDYKQPTMAMDTTSIAPTVKVFDADNVEKSVLSTDSSLAYSASDFSKLQPFTAGNTDYFNAAGKFKTSNSKDYVGKFTVIVSNNLYGLVATQEITVGKKFSSLAAVSPTAVTEVGKSVEVPIKGLDIDGAQVALGDATVTFDSFYVTEKPAGAMVAVEEGSGFQKKMKETGAASVIVTSNTAGKVSAVVKVTVTPAGQTAVTYNVPLTAEFGAPAPAIGAKNVTMFINSKGFTKDGAAAVCDVAPFIKDGRTMVEVRAVANAFGVKAEDIAFANGVVTLKREDVTVTITIGSANITTSAGKTITSDVAAYVTPEGRTVLPIRFIGDAFGYTAAYDATTQSVSFTK